MFRNFCLNLTSREQKRLCTLFSVTIWCHLVSMAIIVTQRRHKWLPSWIFLKVLNLIYPNLSNYNTENDKKKQTAFSDRNLQNG